MTPRQSPRIARAAAALTLAMSGLMLSSCSDDSGATSDAGAGDSGAISDAAALDVGGQIDGTLFDGGAQDGTTGPSVPEGKGIAVIGSDFTSITVSLIDPKTLKVTKDNCVSSGSKPPKLSQAFSGDVVLPSQPQPGNELVLIDRKNSTLTWVDPASCAVIKQYSVSTKFSANPHDVVTVGGKLFVPRYNANAKPTSDPNDYDEGSDVLIVDAKTGKIEGRIDLTSYATKASGKVLPRPDRAVLLGGMIYVSLINVGPTYAANEIGPGRIVAIDPKKRKVVKSYDVSGLYNCGGLQVTPERAGLLVACNGNFKKTDGTQIDGSGVRRIPISGATQTIAAKKLGRPVSFEYVASYNHKVGYVVVPGKFGGSPADTLWSFDLAAGTVKKVLTGSSGFVLGGLAVDRSGKHLFAADATKSKPRVQVFDIKSPSSPTAPKQIDATAKTGLPPRYVGWY